MKHPSYSSPDASSYSTTSSNLVDWPMIPSLPRPLRSPHKLKPHLRASSPAGRPNYLCHRCSTNVHLKSRTRNTRTGEGKEEGAAPYWWEGGGEGGRWMGDGRRRCCAAPQRRRLFAAPTALSPCPLAVASRGLQASIRRVRHEDLIRVVDVECGGKARPGRFSFQASPKRTSIPLHIWIKNGPQHSNRNGPIRHKRI
jgi:hypothetical protein